MGVFRTPQMAAQRGHFQLLKPRGKYKCVYSAYRFPSFSISRSLSCSQGCELRNTRYSFTIRFCTYARGITRSRGVWRGAMAMKTMVAEKGIPDGGKYVGSPSVRLRSAVGPPSGRRRTAVGTAENTSGRRRSAFGAPSGRRRAAVGPPSDRRRTAVGPPSGRRRSAVGPPSGRVYS